MRTYLIQDDQITVATSTPSKLREGVIAVRSLKDLDAQRFPVDRLIALLNALPGADPVKRLTSRTVGIKRLWAGLERLNLKGTKRSDSKQAKIIALLRRTDGASIDELMAATGWQRHTVRGVLSGAIKKKLGLPLVSSRSENGAVYRIGS